MGLDQNIYEELMGELSLKSGRVWNPSIRRDPEFSRLVKKELVDFVQELDFSIEEPGILEALLVQSILGRAQNGHGSFGDCGREYESATMLDVINAAGLSIKGTKKKRQILVNEVYQWVDRAIDGKISRLTLDNHPLLGVQFLRDYQIDIEFVLRGMALAGYMDNYDARQETMRVSPKTIKGSPLEIGGGETFLVDSQMMHILGYSHHSLGRIEHDEERLEALRKIGMIVNKRRKGVESAYIRRKKGPGTSDDLAFIMIANMYKHHGMKAAISAMLGAFVVDAIDTYDKCVTYPEEGGLDEVLADYIQIAWKDTHGEELVSKREIQTVIYYAAKSNNPRVSASSSHRRLVQYEGDKIWRPTILSHLAFVEGKPTGDFKVGFSRMNSKTFYQRAATRVAHLLKNLPANI